MISEEAFSSNNMNIPRDLLLLTNLKNSRVTHLNDTVEKYCGINLEECNSQNICFYKEFVHPEDYPDYMLHLESFSSKNDDEEKITYLRLKNKQGEWNKFRFKDRVYKKSSDKENTVILSLASKVAEIPVKQSGLTNQEDENQTKSDYQYLLEGMDEAFCIVEIIFNKNEEPEDCYFLKTNPAFEKHINLKNVIGKTIREIFPSPSEDWVNKIAEVARTGDSVRFQDYSENLDKSWLDLYAFRIGGKQSTRVAILFRNITQRIEAEKALAKSRVRLEEKANLDQQYLEDNKELLQIVFDTTNLAVAVLQTVYNEDGSIKDFTFIKTNKVLRDIYLDKDVTGQSYIETSHHGVEMGIFDAFKKVIVTGEPFEREFFFDKDGYHNWFRVTARSQKDILVTSIEDITQRKVEAQLLHDSIQFKKQLVKTSLDTILIVNMNTLSIRYINKDIFKEGGITKEKIEGSDITEVLPYIHPRDREKLLELHKKLLKSKDEDIYDIEIRLKLRGIIWEWFSVRGKIFQRKDDKWVDEYVLMIRNIHDQKSTRKALHKAERLSIQGELARTFAHELRNPLASIGMATEIVTKKLPQELKHDFESYLKILTRSTKTLNNLVTNLLNSANYTPSVLKINDLGAIVAKTITKASDRIYLSGIIVSNEIKGTYNILADEEKLIIALLNIIVNASEATTPGEGKITLSIYEVKTDFVLSISDNGHGLEKEQIDKLFDAFYTNKETGMGVGLNAVKNILEEHDAFIKVESEPNIGTTFKIFFHNADLVN